MAKKMEQDLFNQLAKCDNLEILRILNQLICEKIKLLEIVKAILFDVGDKVKFTPTKKKYHGREISGTVTGIKKGSVHLKTAEGMRWRVAASMLQKIKD